jgi:glycosyltransferase involved in cell wall biosynthesis
VIRSVPSDDPDAMRALLEATTLVVSMSDFETQPLAALEALSAGCGLLVADTSGLKELADSGAARAIPLDSAPQAVAEAIVTELTATRSTVRPELTTWDDCATDLLALYQEVACAS